VEFTNFQETARNKVVIEDGRRFLRRSQEHWDWIVIDAFVRNSQYPPHMATREFFQIVADHLGPSGLLAINVIGGNKLFDCLIATIASVFRDVVLFNVPGSGNVIALASMGPSGSMARTIAAAAPPSSSLMADNGVDLVEMRAAGAAANPVGCSNPLTDDFSPTEFLGAQWRK
jgi:spermidine synthase